MKQDINKAEDVVLMVDEFYSAVRKDPLIGPIFIGLIKDRWPEHLAKLYRFWETVLLDKRTYSGAPFAPHAEMPLQEHHFNRWLELFYSTVDRYFEGEKAEEAKMRATKMAQMFLIKIQYFKGGQGRTFI